MELVATKAAADERSMPPVMTEVVKDALAADHRQLPHFSQWDDSYQKELDGAGAAKWSTLLFKYFHQGSKRREEWAFLMQGSRTRQIGNGAQTVTGEAWMAIGVVRWMKLVTSNFEVIPLNADAASIPETVSSHWESATVSGRSDSVAASWLKPEKGIDEEESVAASSREDSVAASWLKPEKGIDEEESVAESWVKLEMGQSSTEEV
eukprot:s225_g7.t1